MLAWIVSPITQYAALAVALLSFLVLFVSLKLEISVVRRALAQPSRAPEPAAPPVQAAIPAPAPSQGLPGPELNLTARAQALRMLARGESASTVAAALRTPQNEIDLLLKVQNLRNIPA